MGDALETREAGQNTHAQVRFRSGRPWGDGFDDERFTFGESFLEGDWQYS